MVASSSITLRIVRAFTSTTYSKTRLFSSPGFPYYFIITDTIIIYKRLYKFMCSSLLLFFFLNNLLYI